MQRFAEKVGDVGKRERTEREPADGRAARLQAIDGPRQQMVGVDLVVAVGAR